MNPVLSLQRATVDGLGPDDGAGWSLHVPPGLTLVEGPSGSGKTQLLETLAAVRTPRSGEVLWHGKRLEGAILDGYRRSRGWVPSARWAARTLTVGDAFHLAAALWQIPRPEARVDRELARWGLERQRGRKVGHLSAGQEHRLRLGLSLLMDPTVWILDQPFDDLDQRERVVVQTLVLNMLGGAGGRAGTCVVMAGAGLEDWLLPREDTQVRHVGRLALSTVRI